jgi:hypothetical protein
MKIDLNGRQALVTASTVGSGLRLPKGSRKREPPSSSIGAAGSGSTAQW